MPSGRPPTCNWNGSVNQATSSSCRFKWSHSFVRVCGVRARRITSWRSCARSMVSWPWLLGLPRGLTVSRVGRTPECGVAAGCPPGKACDVHVVRASCGACRAIPWLVFSARTNEPVGSRPGLCGHFRPGGSVKLAMNTCDSGRPPRFDVHIRRFPSGLKAGSPSNSVANVIRVRPAPFGVTMNRS